MRKVLAFAILSIIIIACSSNDGDYMSLDYGAQLDQEIERVIVAQGSSLAEYTFPESDAYDQIPQDPNNKLTRSKVELGKMLFHETALASESNFANSMGTYSCASCHHAEGGFQANVPQGIGDGGIGFGYTGESRMIDPRYSKEDIDVQPIRTPTALNSAYQKLMLWNGQFGATSLNEGTEAQWTDGTPIATNKLGFEGVEIQAIAGLSVHRFGLSIDEAFISGTEYKELFDIAFLDLSEDERYNSTTAGLAIAAYERTLLATKSPWQEWLKGNSDALTNNQKKGALVFFDKGCASCHNGPALNSMEFHAIGMGDLTNNSRAINVTSDMPVHKGRGGFTGKAEDNYKFKVPQLYNLKDSPFLGHGSTFESIEEVLLYKNAGVKQNQVVPDEQMAPTFGAKGMTPSELQSLEDFIKNGLYDPQLTRYQPSSLPSGNCFPNNDALSRVDLECI